MNNLFKDAAKRALAANAPLADRMRPRSLDEFAGQEHILGHGKLLRRAIEADRISSVIFYGPPGTGKTTLGRIIARHTKSWFTSLSAVLAGVKDIRAAVQSAQRLLEERQQRTILFIDEVHRFNKAQQDALLPHVESGLVVLVGATTENPYFEVIKALVSRSRIFELKQLSEDDLTGMDHPPGHGDQSIEGANRRRLHGVEGATPDLRAGCRVITAPVRTSNLPQDAVDASLHGGGSPPSECQEQDPGRMDPLSDERGDAVGVLPYDPIRDELVMLEQLWIGALRDSETPWLQRHGEALRKDWQ